jgi:anti-sigma regulatory factor (Ser/Thr protein kinase)
MVTKPSSLQIVLQAKLEQLPVLERWVEALAMQLLVPRSLLHRIDLCLTELVTNLIGYGYPDEGMGTVSIQCWRQPEQIVIRIDDDGIAFDPTAYVPPDLPSSLADASAGGRGIRLVRHFADGLQHIRKVDGNQLTLLFRNPGAETHSSAALAAREPVDLRSTRPPL